VFEKGLFDSGYRNGVAGRTFVVKLGGHSLTREEFKQEQRLVVRDLKRVAPQSVTCTWNGDLLEILVAERISGSVIPDVLQVFEGSLVTIGRVAY